MEAFRKSRIKNQNQKVVIELPADFKAKEVDVVIWASETTEENEKMDIEQWRKELVNFYSKYEVDLSNFKFNRDELYDRP